MKFFSSYHLVAALLSLYIVIPSRAGNFTTTTSQSAGSNPNWNSAIWNPGAVAPVSGNSYEALAGALLRSPYSANPQPFNGDSLQLDSGSEIRLKAFSSTNVYTFGVNGVFLSGGLIGNGDDQFAVINSPITVVTNSGIFAGPDATSINAVSGGLQGFRSSVFNGSLSGSGNLILGNAVMYNNPQVTAKIGPSPNFIFNGNGSAYSGAITITAGWLQAGSANSFGSANIVLAGGSATTGVNGPAEFSASLTFSSMGTLTVLDTNSTLLLDKSLTFGGAVIDGVSLAPGNYTASQINSATTFNNAAGTNILTVGTLSAPIQSVTWAGSINGNWNTVAGNWTFGGAVTNYADGDNVFFDDTATNSNVVLAVSVSPASVNASNNALSYAFSGVGGIIGTGGLIKQGTNTLILGETNNYSGATTVASGTLLVNGKINGSAAVAVNANATLGGSGAIVGPVTIQAAGTFAPGVGTNVVGTKLTLGNNLTLAPGGFTVMGIKTGSLGDQVVCNGTIIYSGTLSLIVQGASLVAGDTFKLFTAAAYMGNFTTINLPALNPGLVWSNTLTGNGTLTVRAITAPAVINLPASSVLANSATLNGQVVSTGSETPTVTLFYGPADGGTSASGWSNDVVLGLQSGSFNFTATGLFTNTSYYFASLASNSAGSTWTTPSGSFVTLAANPANISQTQIQYLSGTDKDHTVPWQFLMTGGGRSNNILTTIPVPSCWQTKGFGSYSYGNHSGNGTAVNSMSVGQYSTTFSVPANWAGEKICIVFEGVLTDTSVSINGSSVGVTHQGGFYEFSYDVTPYVVAGASTNVLNVTVNEWSANASVNQAEREGDFWNFSGIFRPVYLKAVPASHIDRLAVNAQANGLITVSTYLGGIVTNCSLNAFVTDTNDVQLGSAFSAPVSPGMSNVTFSASLPSPNLWSSESPTLYTLTVQLLDTNNVVVHMATDKIGFRTITFSNNVGYLVNGKKVVLRGVNRHEFWPTDGRTTSLAESDLDIQLIKDMNFNAVRMSHYPPNKIFLNECDRLGLYIFDELTGWQQAYDNTVASNLVQELVIRDVDHPCIIAWDNGNEGGWNTTVDNNSVGATNVYAIWDPQNRHVNRPSSTFNNVQDDHYPGYFSGNVGAGKIAYSCTEILHGLFDGGGGASLPDYWELMRTAPNGIGMFLWAYLDEGLVRNDLPGNPIDVQDQNAPDGIVGPYRQPEASYYAYKSIYNPVQIGMPDAANFTGTLMVSNRFDFTSLSQCTFDWQLGFYPDVADPAGAYSTNALTGGLLVSLDSGNFAGPNMAPGTSGSLILPAFPSNGTNYDALRLTATDPFGNNLYTWTWPLHTPGQIRDRIVGEVPANFPALSVVTNATEIIVTNGLETIHFSKTTGVINSLSVSNQPVSFSNGPRPAVGPAWAVTSFTNYSDGTNYYIAVNSLSSVTNAFLWTLYPNGWLKLDYQYWLTGSQSWLGITFDYPSNNVTSMSWLGQGPYRDYKNRLTGQEVFVHTKATNYTSTGRSILQQPNITPWLYPEFAGYYGQTYWATLQTTEQPITIATPTAGLFLRVLTPPASGNANSDTTYPPGAISLLHGISPIGDKFHGASAYGPSATLNTATGLYSGEVNFYFGSLPQLPAAPAGLIANAGAALVNLGWSSVAGASSYNLKSSAVNGGPYTIIASNLNSQVYTQTGLLNGTTYYYEVTAVNANGESKSSPQASATTPILSPVFGNVSPSGANLIFAGTNGTPGKNYLVLTTTNLFLPLINWQVLATNTFDSSGRFIFSNQLPSSIANQFYILKLP